MAAIVTDASQIAMAITLLVNVPVGILPSKRTELLVPQRISRIAAFSSRRNRIIEITKEKISPKKASQATKAP